MGTYLDRLELHGFKSFPDKTILKFHKGITAVIGPNGCGKSNIVDSILWVMGEQRIKNLRGENNEDLIFKGSSTKKPLGMTEVGAFFVEDDEEIYIARRFFRSGESKYILNERFCRNKDIQDILFKLRLGGTNYFIFEQGSIEKLITLKPTEKRMLIEEAADISKYLLRKKETANKLIISQQNLDNLQILISEKENRLRELKNQVNYAQRYRKLKNEKTAYLKTFLKKQYDLYQAEFKNHQKEMEKFINHETLLVKDIGNQEKTILKLEESRWNIDKELKQNQQIIFDYNKKAITASNEVEKSKQNRVFMSEKIKEIEVSNTKSNQELADIDKESAAASSQVKELKNKLRLENSGYQEIESKLKDLKNRVKTENDRKDQLRNGIFRLQSEIASINNKLREADKGIVRLENQIDTKKNFIVQLRDQIPLKEIGDKENHNKSLELQHREKMKHFSQIESQRLLLKRDLEELETQIKKVNNEVENLGVQKEKYLQIKNTIIEDQVEPSSSHHGYLQELIHTEKKYYKILENFYSNEMDALILKDNDNLEREDYNKCLLKVKREDYFQDQVKILAEETGFKGWVKDLYTLKNPELKEYLKNGVLVDNLKNGIRLFLEHQLDIVTLDGEVIARDGLLIRNRQKGILDIIGEMREIDKKRGELSKERDQLKSQFEDKTKEQVERIKNVKKSREELDSVEKELLQVTSSLQALRDNREANLKRIKFTESENELLQMEKRKLKSAFDINDEKRTGLEEKYSKSNDQQERISKEIEAIKEKINAIEKNHLHKENSVNLIKEKMNSLDYNLQKFTSRKDLLINTLKSNELEIKNLDREINRLNQFEASTKEEVKGLNQSKAALESKVNNQEGEFSKINNDIKGNSEDLNIKRKKLEELKENRKDVEIKLSSIKKDLFQLEDLCFKELNSELEKIEADPELWEYNINELEPFVENYNERLIRMRDSNKLNFSAEAEYDLLSKDFEFLLTQKEDVVKSIEDMNDAIKKIDEESKISFSEAFDKIKKNFKKNFQILFEGGEAELNIMEPDNILETGLEIKAQPPGKRLLSLKLLSGGEKTLTALAFLFSLFEYKPSPFCVFDEVDASLDEANIKRFLNFLHKLKDKTQFLIITHNFKTMEEADFLYGISMNEPGISTIYSMKMTDKGKFQTIG